jgi:hypothetical protein
MLKTLLSLNEELADLNWKWGQCSRLLDTSSSRIEDLEELDLEMGAMLEAAQNLVVAT